jgi:DNA-binding IclR family transcriptional regulator
VPVARELVAKITVMDIVYAKCRLLTIISRCYTISFIENYFHSVDARFKQGLCFPMISVSPATGPLRDRDHGDGRYTIRALDRGIRILSLLADGKPRTLSDVSFQVGLTSSTTFRLLVTLAGHNYVARDAGSGKYALGLSCLDLARAYQEGDVIRRTALPILQALRDETMETVHLAVLDGMDVLYLDKQPGLRAIGLMSSHVGARFPAYCTGLGKALLAYVDPDLVRAHFDRVGLRCYTDSTILTVDALLHDLEQARRRGFALDHGEHESEVRCVAVPIFGNRGMALAALSVAGPASRIDPLESNHVLIEQTVAAARSVSRKLTGQAIVEPAGS